MSSQRRFEITLPPSASDSEAKILLDGIDITGLLRGIDVSSSLTKPTRITLKPAVGHRAELVVMLPEAQVVIAEEPTRARRLRTRG